MKQEWNELKEFIKAPGNNNTMPGVIVGYYTVLAKMTDIENRLYTKSLSEAGY